MAAWITNKERNLHYAMNFFFQNIIYTFGGEEFRQGSEGPIGARLTMCIARLTMQDWWDQFTKILDASEIKQYMNAIYVDDGRIVVDILKPGYRFVVENNKIEYSEKWYNEDMGEGSLSMVKRTEVEIVKAMNSVSPDLVFTSETENDFEDRRLPTLSFALWSEKDCICHSYFEKLMRCQILTQKRSSQSEQQKYSILVNELCRRFEVLDSEIETCEKVKIVDHYTQQLTNSGYSYLQIRDIVESGLKGIVRKEECRSNREKRFKSSADTVEIRERKKLIESTSWYRDSDKLDGEVMLDRERQKEEKSFWSSWRNQGVRKRRKQVENKIEIEGKEKLMGVLFVQHTEGSTLAKR